MSGVSNELDVGVESERMSQTSARRGIAFPRSGLIVSVVYIVERDLIRLRPDDFRETPSADPQAGCCGEGRLNAVPYPIKAFFLILAFSVILDYNVLHIVLLY